ncbi:MAG: hypothetical protein EKK53_26555 [Burkholderiales bacterium]|nr:MAG: hypothetical protein EKK53_26555 [Burkholderiales bacterium]
MRRPASAFSRRQLLALPAWLSAARLLAAPPGAGEPVRMPRHISMPDPQMVYVRRVVDLAIARAGSRLEVKVIDLEMTQGRSLVELASGRSPIDLMWTVTDLQRETSGLLPIRVPIDRGLMGWRLILVRRADLPRWRRVRSLAELGTYVGGQGHDWPDTTILRANGLQIGTSSSYEALFRMLAAGRIDYFPRSILEIDAELANHRDMDLAIVPGLMLHYPTAAYLFASPARPELAADLKAGLDAAVADGSFQRLHREFYGPVIKAHPADPDRVIRLSNPLLPAATPLARRELWLQPGDAF